MSKKAIGWLYFSAIVLQILFTIVFFGCLQKYNVASSQIAALTADLKGFGLPPVPDTTITSDDTYTDGLYLTIEKDQTQQEGDHGGMIISIIFMVLGAVPGLIAWTGGFLPRMPQSLEKLDLLLLTVTKTRRVQQDGIRFQNYRYLNTTLAGYVKEDVLIRYDPADLAEIYVFHQDQFVCRAICQELAGQTVSLKEIEKARSEQRKRVKAGLSPRQSVVEQFIAVHQEEASSTPPKEQKQGLEPAQPRLKRYIHE